ncbi:Uncharacterized protein TCM_011071 [Theobroma cacao]|uniref:Uncharacterized protein n=1 Tax=Theobroma cacao TaxID=3641 RepID=A0A061EFR0_THECC|nr:Uncharacterized protein TCM_011071 [Theobroma cacao]
MLDYDTRLCLECMTTCQQLHAEVITECITCSSTTLYVVPLFDIRSLNPVKYTHSFPKNIHIKKFRLYLKRISGVAQQGGISNPLCGPLEQNVKIGSLGRFDIQALAASGQIPPQTLAALHAELLGRLTAFPNTSHNPFRRLQKPKQQQQQSTVPEPSRSINVQPCCLVVPSQSSAGFQSGNSGVSVNQNGSFSRTPVNDYSLLSSQSNNSSLNIGQVSDEDLQTTGVRTQTSSMTFKASRHLPGFVHSTRDAQGPYGGTKSGEVLDQAHFLDLGYFNKEACLPTWFAVDEFQSPMSSSSSRGKVFAEDISTRVKQEPKARNQHLTSKKLIAGMKKEMQLLMILKCFVGIVKFWKITIWNLVWKLNHSKTDKLKRARKGKATFQERSMLEQLDVGKR